MSKYDPNYVYMPTYYIVGVKTIVSNSSGEILLLKRSEKTARAHGWDFTGGAVENGEDPAVTAERETKEESGLDIYDIKPLATHTYERKKEGKKDYVVIIGFCAKTKSNKVKLTWEHEDYRWVDPKSALDLEWPETHKKFLDAFLD